MSRAADLSLVHDATPKGQKVLSEWQSAQEYLRRAERDLVSAKNAVNEATKALGDWLVPEGFPRREDRMPIGIWVRDRHNQEVLVKVTPGAHGAYVISIHPRRA